MSAYYLGAFELVRKKVVRVYPYFVDLKLKDDTPSFWQENFKQEKSKDNLVHYGDYFLVLVVTNVLGHKVFGEFLKLRDDRPKKFNRDTGEKTEIPLLDEENVIESSYFIYYIKDKIAVAQYNFEGVRHFISPLKSYFEKRFGSEDVEVLCIPDVKTLELLRKEKILKSFDIKIAREKLSHLEKTYGISAFRAFMDRFTKENHATLKITIGRSRKSEDTLDRDQTIEVAMKLKEELGNDGLEQLKIEGLNAKYDILNGNTIYFILKLNFVHRTIDPQEFYSKADSIYGEYREILQQTYKNFK